MLNAYLQMVLRLSVQGPSAQRRSAQGDSAPRGAERSGGPSAHEEHFLDAYIQVQPNFKTKYILFKPKYILPLPNGMVVHAL